MTALKLYVDSHATPLIRIRVCAGPSMERLTSCGVLSMTVLAWEALRDQLLWGDFAHVADLSIEADERLGAGR